MKEEKSFAGFVRKKCVTKRTKLFFFVVEPHRRQHADWGRSATAAAFHPIRGLRHLVARASVCCSLNERQVLILAEKLGVIIVVAIFLFGIVLRVKNGAIEEIKCLIQEMTSSR